MSGFGGFGAGTSGGGLFGAKTTNQPTGGFNVGITTVSTGTTGSTFGTPSFGAATTGLFGRQQTPAFGTGSSFGMKPATTATTGFTFGTGIGSTTPAFGSPGTSATPTFGVPAASTAPTFGVPAASTAPAFGVPSASTAPAFGIPSTSAAPAFGAPATGISAPAFGTPSTGAQTGFGSFGSGFTPTFGVTTTTTTTAMASTTGTVAPTFGSGTLNTTKLGTSTFNINAPKTTASTGFFFPTTSTAAATTTVAPTFNLGVTPATTTTAAAPTTFSFGVSNTPTTITTATTTTAPTLSFTLPTTTGVAVTTTTATTTTTTTGTTGFTLTQPSTSTALTFGTPKTTGGFTFGTATTTTTTTTTASTTTTGTLMFNLGTTTTTAPSLNTGLFGTPKTTEGLSITTTTTSVGLGGVDYTQKTQGLSGSGTLEPKQARDHTLPDPILQTLTDFQNFTKQQKSISVEISHGSSKPLKKVQEDTEAMESLLTTITSGLARNSVAADKLKTETAQGLHQAEMAQRNHETPPGLEYDNSAPCDYFNDLVTKFETDTVRLKVQIEASEKHLKSLTQCSTISPQELTLAMRRLHETLIVLAARVQALHTTVQSQKEQFKNLKRVYFKDDANALDNEADQSRVKKQTMYSLWSLTGPTPFSETPGTGLPLQVDGLAMLASSAACSMGTGTTTMTTSTTTAANSSWMSPLQGSPNLGPATSPGLFGCFGQTLDAPGFQLSKPPTGNKRSKR